MMKWLEGRKNDRKRPLDAEELTDKTVDKMTDKRKRKTDETWPIFGVKLKKTVTDLAGKKEEEEKLTRSIQKRSVSDIINKFNLITSDAGNQGFVADGQQAAQAHRGGGAKLAVKEDLVPGGQVGMAGLGEQQLGRRLAENGTNRSGRTFLQKSVRGLNCELEVKNCPDRLEILSTPRLHCNAGAGSATFTKPNFVLNVDFVPTNDRKEFDTAARTDCPQD